MRILACDWATKKALKIYDSQTSKVKTIQNSIPEFDKFLKSLKTEKVIFLLEFGGADTFKIMAFRAGHQVLQVPGKKIKDYRDSLGLEKTDDIDAKLIHDFFIEKGANDHLAARPSAVLPLLDHDTPDLFSKPIDNEAGAAKTVAARPGSAVPRLKKKQGEGAADLVTNGSERALPFPFLPFTEGYADIAEVKILFREHEHTKKEMVREKLRKIAFKKKFEIAHVSGNRTNMMLMHKDGAIIAKENELKVLKKILEDKVKGFRVWNKYLVDVKGVGPTIAAGLIGELGGRQFDTDESLKHYAGMIPRNESKNYNRYVKVILFQFAEGIIKARTPVWRDLYDSMKSFYRDKHGDWRPSKVNAYAMKFIETKFLIEFWRKWNEYEETKEVSVGG